jgi:hypothetical protein
MAITQQDAPAQPAQNTQKRATPGLDAAEARRQSGATGGEEPTETMRETNPPRSNEHPVHSSEVPLGTGNHAEPPGGGGRASQRKPESGKS